MTEASSEGAAMKHFDLLLRAWPPVDPSPQLAIHSIREYHVVPTDDLDAWEEEDLVDAAGQTLHFMSGKSLYALRKTIGGLHEPWGEEPFYYRKRGAT